MLQSRPRFSANAAVESDCASGNWVISIRRPTPRGCDSSPRNSQASGAPGPFDRPDDPALAATTIEAILAVRLEPRHEDSRRHLDTVDDLPCLRIDVAQLA